MCKTRKRLFQDSPNGSELSTEEFNNLITPRVKCSPVLKLQFPDTKRSKKSLFGGKRPADDFEYHETPDAKKPRHNEEHVLSQLSSSNEIKTVVENLASQRDLVADGSRDHILPTIPGKHSDLKSISVETMADVLNGDYNNEFSRVTIVDSRYPYEYAGGHIQGAINLYTKDEVYSLLKQRTATDKPHILIFHCEFSSERGPKMYRFLRNEDRQLNKDSYPKLNYPEVYLLHGGYKEFYNSNTVLCEPNSYKPMLHADHGEDLRHFRRKSKSWTAGEEASKARRRFHRKLLKTSLDF